VKNSNREKISKGFTIDHYEEMINLNNLDRRDNNAVNEKYDTNSLRDSKHSHIDKG